MNKKRLRIVFVGFLTFILAFVTSYWCQSILLSKNSYANANQTYVRQNKIQPIHNLGACKDKAGLCLLNTYPHIGTNGDIWSEGLDFYNGYLWHTTKTGLTKLDPNDDFAVLKTWEFKHQSHTESPVWLDGDLYNLTYRALDGENDAIYKLRLTPNGYSYERAGSGLGKTNWGSCRNLSETQIIYTAEGNNLSQYLLWFDPKTAETTRRQKIDGLSAIEDLGMDHYGTVWASSFSSKYHNRFYRIDVENGSIINTFKGPEDCKIIDGIAIRSFESYDIMYATGKNCPYIYEYLVPELS